MTKPAKTARATLERRARIMNLVNVPMRGVLGLPFKTPLSRQLMLVFYTGRKSGRAYRQPVSYVRDGETLLTPGGGRWKLNLREGEPTKLWLGGHSTAARPELVRDIDEVETLVTHMVSVNRRLTSFVPFVERDGTIDRAKLATALEYGFCVVRWHLDRGRSS
jgi:hypothetical protein